MITISSMTYRGSTSVNGADKFSSIPPVVILYLGVRDVCINDILKFEVIYLNKNHEDD
jgi:hypothetical protein